MGLMIMDHSALKGWRLWAFWRRGRPHWSWFLSSWWTVTWSLMRPAAASEIHGRFIVSRNTRKKIRQFIKFRKFQKEIWMSSIPFSCFFWRIEDTTKINFWNFLTYTIDNWSKDFKNMWEICQKLKFHYG